jgi:1-phosphatidylinositol-4-phosphate 5-kinase
LLKNRDRISTFGGPDGGKSGEFFFFSWDNKIIIKTMQTAEVVALRKRMYLYGNYLFNNPDSMIAKLYGVFTFQRLADNQIVDEAIPTTHFLVMRNISLGYGLYLCCVECRESTFYVRST